MAYEDLNKSNIERLIENREWTAAFNALNEYIRVNGEDYWAKNQLALVKAKM